MDTEIDLTEIWHWVNENVEWLMLGVFGLLFLNVVFLLYFAWSIMASPGFFEKYNLAKSGSFVAKAKSLQEVPDMNDLEVEPPRIRETMPQRFVELKETTMFVPLGERQSQVSTEVASRGQQKLPQIKGYEIVGRIAGEGKNRVSVLKRTKDGRTFIAKEGEHLNKQSDIKVRTVTDTMVLLTQPQHRPTTFQFATDEIKEDIRQYRESVTFH